MRSLRQRLTGRGDRNLCLHNQAEPPSTLGSIGKRRRKPAELGNGDKISFDMRVHMILLQSGRTPSVACMLAGSFENPE